MSAGVPLPPQENVDCNALPTPSQLSEAAAIAVYDEHGQKFHFGHLVHLASSESLSTLGDDKRLPVVPTAAATGNGNGKIAVVFIRHFFCGACQAYVRNLARVPLEALQRAGATVVVVGCGEWEVLSAYRENTGFTGPMYADPSRALYQALGMTHENLKTTPSDEPKPSYLAGSSRVGSLVQSVWKALAHPKLIGKQGNHSQNGGEYVFDEGDCVYASRMRHTEDHIPVVKLMELLGVDYTENEGEEQKPRL
ncbi:AhpC/TSA antioxidant enzyme-domain-containing protein [Coprinopsis sp. MPI-PUGE-AT-0042]|nr:AhpC/TSA antioxidant enzyme-domain-containing protein [Coprinopsis sp. MPI-PUGE-AT-0042]